MNEKDLKLQLEENLESQRSVREWQKPAFKRISLEEAASSGEGGEDDSGFYAS